jgi:hypothetical protein
MAQRGVVHRRRIMTSKGSKYFRFVVPCIVMLSLVAILYFAGAASISRNTAAGAHGTVSFAGERS